MHTCVSGVICCNNNSSSNRESEHQGVCACLDNCGSCEEVVVAEGEKGSHGTPSFATVMAEAEQDQLGIEKGILREKKEKVVNLFTEKKESILVTDYLHTKTTSPVQTSSGYPQSVKRGNTTLISIGYHPTYQLNKISGHHTM